MLSRITRFGSLGAHLATGCSLLREQHTAPRDVASLDYIDSSNTFKVFYDKSLASLSEPTLKRDHDIFLSNILQSDPWKSDATSSEANTSSGDRSLAFNDALEWSGVLSNMGWIDKCETSEFPTVRSEPNETESISCCESKDLLEDSLSLIDWKAWNSYLDGEDGELEYDEKSSKEEFVPAAMSALDLQEEGESNDVVTSLSKDEMNIKMSEIERCIARSSGPLTWLPSSCDCDEEWNQQSGESTSIAESECRMPKRRSKTTTVEEMNHRRCLNREAASRYRERKRTEQRERKRELECLISRNSSLKKRIHDLQLEIAFWVQKLNEVKC